MLKVQQFIEEHDVDTLTRDYVISSHSSIKQESTSFEGDVTDIFQKLSAEQEPLGGSLSKCYLIICGIYIKVDEMTEIAGYDLESQMPYYLTKEANYE